MRQNLQVIESGILDPAAIMAKDTLLLSQMVDGNSPILHFYEWSVPCMTFGYFIDPDRYLNLAALEKSGIQLARRPTGGGIIFHLTDFAFSILFPANHTALSLNPLENYTFINLQVAKCIAQMDSSVPIPSLCHPISITEQNLSFCMAAPTQFDLLIGGRKVVGAAQRRTKKGLLHQASISLQSPSFELLQKVLKNSQEIVECMKATSYYLISEDGTLQALQEARQKLKESLKISLNF